MNVIAPINGAVSNQMRAQTIHEKIQIRCFADGTSSPVLLTKTVCEQVVAIFDSIASVIPRITYTFSETKKNKI